jgi:hypothetical protein
VGPGSGDDVKLAAGLVVIGIHVLMTDLSRREDLARQLVVSWRDVGRDNEGSDIGIAALLELNVT